MFGYCLSLCFLVCELPYRKLQRIIGAIPLRIWVKQGVNHLNSYWTKKHSKLSESQKREQPPKLRNFFCNFVIGNFALLSYFVTKRPFSLEVSWESPIGHSRNLPFGKRATQGSRVRLLWEENAQSRHQHLFEENVEKTRTCDLWTLIVKGSRVVFIHGKGISILRVRHKGQQPLIKCANMNSKCFIFPFLCLFVFLCFYVFCIF